MNSKMNSKKWVPPPPKYAPTAPTTILGPDAQGGVLNEEELRDLELLRVRINEEIGRSRRGNTVSVSSALFFKHAGNPNFWATIAAEVTEAGWQPSPIGGQRDELIGMRLIPIKGGV